MVRKSECAYLCNANPLRSYYCRFCGGYHLTSKVTKSEAEQLAKFVSAA